MNTWEFKQDSERYKPNQFDKFFEENIKRIISLPYYSQCRCYSMQREINEEIIIEFIFSYLINEWITDKEVETVLKQLTKGFSSDDRRYIRRELKRKINDYLTPISLKKDPSYKIIKSNSDKILINGKKTPLGLTFPQEHELKTYTWNRKKYNFPQDKPKKEDPGGPIPFRKWLEKNSFEVPDGYDGFEETLRTVQPIPNKYTKLFPEGPINHDTLQKIVETRKDKLKLYSQYSLAPLYENFKIREHPKISNYYPEKYPKSFNIYTLSKEWEYIELKPTLSHQRIKKGSFLFWNGLQENKEVLLIAQIQLRISDDRTYIKFINPRYIKSWNYKKGIPAIIQKKCVFQDISGPIEIRLNIGLQKLVERSGIKIKSSVFPRVPPPKNHHKYPYSYPLTTVQRKYFKVWYDTHQLYKKNRDNPRWDEYEGRDQFRRSVMRKPLLSTGDDGESYSISDIIRKDTLDPRYNAEYFNSLEVGIGYPTLKHCPECRGSVIAYDEIRGESFCPDCGLVRESFRPDNIKHEAYKGPVDSDNAGRNQDYGPRYIGENWKDPRGEPNRPFYNNPDHPQFYHDRLMDALNVAPEKLPGSMDKYEKTFLKNRCKKVGKGSNKYKWWKMRTRRPEKKKEGLTFEEKDQIRFEEKEKKRIQTLNNRIMIMDSYLNEYVLPRWVREQVIYILKQNSKKFDFRNIHSRLKAENTLFGIILYVLERTSPKHPLINENDIISANDYLKIKENLNKLLLECDLLYDDSSTF